MKLPIVIFLAGIAAWFALSEAGTEMWYRWHEERAEKTPEWTILWPDDPKSKWSVAQFEELPVAESVKELLRFDRARFARWIDPEQRTAWNINLIEWKPDKSLNGVNAVHNPTVCMPSAGFTLVQDFGTQHISVGGITIPFRAYEFASQGRSIFMFSTLLQELNLAQMDYAGAGLSGRAVRTDAVVNANRQSPTQVVHIAIVGPRTFENALAAFDVKLPEVIATNNLRVAK